MQKISWVMLLLLFNAGCTTNQPDRPIGFSDEPLGPEHGLRFDWQLAKLQLDSLIQQGAQWCFPAAVVQAKTKQTRIAHEIEGNLLLDAANDLIILRKNLTLLEQRLDYVKSQTRCVPPNEATIGEEIMLVEKLVELLNADNQFAQGSAEINPKYMRNLADAAFMLREAPTLNLSITGHADMTGDSKDNQRLAMARAKQVERYLLILGLPPSRISTQAVGESLPLFEGETAAVKLTNRRVSIDIVSTQAQEGSNAD